VEFVGLDGHSKNKLELPNGWQMSEDYSWPKIIGLLVQACDKFIS